MSAALTEIVDTPHGRARVDVSPGERAGLVLGHGAAGGVGAPDLVAVAEAAGELGLAVALVEQPYRVAGRRSQPRAPVLDAAWLAVVSWLRAGPLAGLALVAGGRSAGARVACRTAAEASAAAVLCLAFPLRPPGGRPSRRAELDGVTVPVLVVQGERDPFGMPAARPGLDVVAVPGTHRLSGGAVRAPVARWLAGLPALGS